MRQLPFLATERVVFARATLALALVAVGGNALSLPDRHRVGRYDFAYAIRGDRAARPAQVFDDGAGKVYFQPRPGAPMPAVFAGQPLALVVTRPEGAYFTAQTDETAFTLALGDARASVRRGAGAAGLDTSGGASGVLLASAAPGLPAGIAFDGDAAASGDPVNAQPVRFAPGRATLAPAVLDALSALVLRIDRDAVVVVEGHDDELGTSGPASLARRRAEALRNAMLARGIAPARLEMRAIAIAAEDGARATPSTIRWRRGDVAAVPPPPDFDIAADDADIAVTLRRWARASGWEVVWDVGWTAPVTGELRLDSPSFLDAVKDVVAGLRAQGYPVRAQAFTDHVVRIAPPEAGT